MIPSPRRHLQRFAWFIAGLLCTVLFSFGLPSVWQSVTAASDNDVDFTTQSTSFLAPSVEEVATSHREPNFYK